MSNRLVLVLTIIVILITAIGGLPSALSAPSPTQGVVGSWVTFPTGVPGHVLATPSLFTYTSDGAVLLDSSTPGTTGGHGVWAKTGDHSITATFYLLLHNAGGDFIGIRKFRMKVVLSAAFDAYAASGKFDFFNAQGTLVQSVDFTTRGTRIKVESP